MVAIPKQLLLFLVLLLAFFSAVAQRCGGCPAAPKGSRYKTDIGIPASDENDIKATEGHLWTDLSWLSSFTNTLIYCQKSGGLAFSLKIETAPPYLQQIPGRKYPN